MFPDGAGAVQGESGRAAGEASRPLGREMLAASLFQATPKLPESRRQVQTNKEKDEKAKAEIRRDAQDTANAVKPQAPVSVASMVRPCKQRRAPRSLPCLGWGVSGRFRSWLG